MNKRGSFRGRAARRVSGRPLARGAPPRPLGAFPLEAAGTQRLPNPRRHDIFALTLNFFFFFYRREVMIFSKNNIEKDIESAARHAYCSLFESGKGLGEIECHLEITVDDVIDSPYSSFSYNNEKGTLVVQLSARKERKKLLEHIRLQEGIKEDKAFGGKMRENTFPVITPTFAATFSPQDFLVLLVLMPGNYCMWNLKRKNIICLMENLTKEEKVFILLKELLTTDLILSKFPKSDTIWFYRFFLIESMFKIVRQSEMIVESLFRNEQTTVFVAAHNHCMNYIAWGYFRKVVTYYITQFNSLLFSFVESRINNILDFLVEHNSDRSASSCLLFLLNVAIHYNLRCNIHAIWRKLMLFNQREIRRHCEIGHEGMWELRLDLITFALKHRNSDYRIFSSWTAKDELDFVSLYTDGYGLEPSLVFPISSRQGWCDISGNFCWTSFFALRYGLRLIDLLGRK